MFTMGKVEAASSILRHKSKSTNDTKKTNSVTHNYETWYLNFMLFTIEKLV